MNIIIKILAIIGVFFIIVIIVSIIAEIKEENKKENKQQDYRNKSKEITNNTKHKIDENTEYKKFINNQTNFEFRSKLSELYKSIQELEEKKLNFQSEFDMTKYKYIMQILDRSNEIECLIDRYWEDKKLKKDFMACIGLHYASHMLSQARKSEQLEIKKMFVSYKEAQDQWTDKINISKEEKNKYNGQRRAEIEKNIYDMCEIHKNISRLKNKLGEINTIYLNEIKEIDKKTGDKRDYITHNFGKRGLDWRERLDKRKEQLKNSN